MVLYWNLDHTDPATINRTHHSVRYGGIVFEFLFLAILSMMSSLAHSESMRSAPIDSDMTKRRSASRTELTFLPSDSLYLGRPSLSYPRSIGHPARVPTQMNTIVGELVHPERVATESENSPSVNHTIERCGVLP